MARKPPIKTLGVKRWPKNPEVVYAEGWKGWDAFLGVQRPKRFTAHELAKVRVTILNADKGTVRCDDCRSKWAVTMKRGGRLTNGYWKCEKGCNVAA